MTDGTGEPGRPLRLALARASAWGLLLAGWVGIGALALARSAELLVVYALVAFWLLAVGLAATVATRDTLRAWPRRAALIGFAGVTAAALVVAGGDRSLGPLLVAAAGWAALTPLASGVVRSARLVHAAQPAPPVAAAALGALVAAIAIGDPGDAVALAQRLVGLVLGLAAVLVLLQPADQPQRSPSACRAGLFDCSLPAWPAGAWREVRQWPTLLAGLAMLPMMAALPAMVAWCRSESAIAPQLLVGLHFAAMFLPALLLRPVVARWPLPRLALGCALLLAGGAAAALVAPAPWDSLGVALAHGAAWSIAWTGQLWSPQRRGRQGASPLRAAVGYAMLTLAVGVAVDRFGPAGLALVHAALGAAALAAWGAGRMSEPAAAAG